MSQVRLCDKCGNIFREGAVGSSTFTGSTIVQSNDGRRSTEQVFMDACPPCTACTLPAIEQRVMEG